MNRRDFKIFITSIWFDVQVSVRMELKLKCLNSIKANGAFGLLTQDAKSTFLTAHNTISQLLNIIKAPFEFEFWTIVAPAGTI